MNLVVTAVLLATLGLSGPGDPQTVFRFQDSRIVESSSLVDLGHGLTATANDSGDDGIVYVVDRSGRTVGTTRYGESDDAEAMAPARESGYVWVGDLGDNLAQRRDVALRRVPVGRGDRTVVAPTYRLVYPDGAHDAETLVRDPTTGRLYVATKGVLGGTLYAAPETLDPDGPNELEPVGDVLPIATDGGFLPDGKRLVIRNYAVAAVYAFPSMEKLDQFQLPDQEQGEGIAVDHDRTLLLSSEGVHSDVLRVPLPAAAASSPAPTASPTARTEPHQETELGETTQTQRSAWPWLLGGVVGLGMVLVLTLSLRRR